jgi:hypothetical protein
VAERWAKHKPAWRGSDVDFKVVPLPAAPVSRNGIRRALGKLGDHATAALLAAGFVFDPKDEACTRSQNENRYTVWQLPYSAVSGAGEGLRPTIQMPVFRRKTVIYGECPAADLLGIVRVHFPVRVHRSGNVDGGVAHMLKHRSHLS